MAKDVRFNIKISVDGKDQVVQAVTSTKDLQNVVNGAKDSTMKFAATLVRLNQTAQVFDNVSTSLSGLQSAMKELSAGAAAAEIANTKLATVMQQRMNASDQDVASIKQVISAQKDLGVIGGTVQVAGAQQVATFLQEKESLGVLIPAMNDLLAQQRGLNASQEDAVSVANLMGKVMTGQTSALKRVGITFNDAQEQILKYGTESEKAATLAQVITDNVGHMNAELAKTDAGKQKQLENAFAGIKTKIGAIAQMALPYVSFAAQSALLLSSLLKLANGIRTVIAASKLYELKTLALSAGTKAYKASVVTLSAVLRVLKSAFTGTAISATTARVAIKGLMVASGVGAAIWALTAIIDELTKSLDEASTKADELSEAERTGKEEASRVQVELDAERQKLEALIKAKQDTTAAVKHLNETYGDIFGTHKTAAEWYDTLTKKSRIYVNQLAAEATLKAYASKLAEKQMELDENNRKRAELWAHGSAMEEYVDYETGRPTGAMVESPMYRSLKATGRDLVAEINNLRAGALKAAQDAAKWSQAMQSSGGGGNSGGGESTPKATPKATPKKTPPKTAPLDRSSFLTEVKMSVKLVPDNIEELRQQIPHMLGPAIQMPVEPLIRGSLADKRQSVENARQIASTIQGDYDMGLINLDTARGQLKQLNQMVAETGAKIPPLQLSIDTEDFKAELDALGSVTVDSFSSVLENLQALNDMGGGLGKGLAFASDACLLLGQSMQKLGSDSAAAKAGMVLAAVGQLVLSFAQAMTSASKNWITWLAFGVAGVAQLTSLISTIQGFATGGIVSGNSKHGDKMLARVNSGEMILNNRQQANLFKLLDRGRVLSPEIHQPAQMDVRFDASRLSNAFYRPGGDYNFTISGRNLVGVLANETRTSNKRTNIRL